MKKILFAFIIYCIPAKAQYDKEKITSILTSGSSASWTVQGVNTVAEEKAYTFSTNGTCMVQPAGSGAKAYNAKWMLNSPDNIRWFIDIGDRKHELIISFDKKGQRYIKLTRRPDRTRSVYYETLLYPVDK